MSMGVGLNLPNIEGQSGLGCGQASEGAAGHQLSGKQSRNQVGRGQPEEKRGKRQRAVIPGCPLEDPHGKSWGTFPPVPKE